MSAGKTYLKCKCPHCGAEVQYPDYAGGGASSCGKCGKTVLLPRATSVPQPAAPASKPAPAPVAPKPAPVPASVAAPRPASPPAAPKPSPAPVKRVEPSAIRAPDQPAARTGRSSFARVCLWTLNIAIILAVVIVVGNHLKNRPSQSEAPSIPIPLSPPPTTPATPASSVPSVPSPAPPPATMPPAIVTPKTPKLLTDLKIAQVALDQPKGTKGSRLVYVTGILKNDSDHQRFGVRVELDLLDAAGTKVGTATDYRQSLDPRATWQFRAIVTDRRATAAKFTAVKEDE